MDHEKRKQEIKQEWAEAVGAHPNDLDDWPVERIAELELTFDLRHQAEQRGIKRWQEATGRTLTLPDTADFTVWLLDQMFTHDETWSRKIVMAVGKCIQAQRNGRDALASAEWDEVVRIWTEAENRRKP